ncbi:MFS transporter [Georgenia yuyongxinii]|uniref:MFS transporter n=1 Tax=Georgenia yuyongxinii TaxID=2589797 RepID=A0A5B8C2R9_9MICO|nr:MFS transporter [Georgenia yuyongxinii]QDC23525.1 MFS transporter [Georgenia yuyongxinii]
MSAVSDSPVPDRARQARLAVAALFFTNGALFANVIPRYPQIKAELGLSNAAYGTVLAGFPLGALVGGLFAAALIGRFRSSRVAALGIVLLAAAILGIGFAPTAALLAVVLLMGGAVDALVDVAQNAHGLRVQRLYGRSIVNSFHGVWSIGSVTGGLMGAAAAGLQVPLVAHLSVAAAIFAAVALVAYRFLLPGPEDAERVPATVADPNASAVIEPPVPAARGWRRWAGRVPRAAVAALAVLGVLAACGALVEDAGSSWAAVYLSGDLGADAITAGLGFVALSVAMTVGRLTGDRAVDRFGTAAVVRAGGVLVAAGMGLALAWPTVGTTLAGFALAGLGVATLVPAAMHAADELPGLPAGAGLTVVSWLLRVGFLLSPPVVGIIADAAGLRAGLLTVVVAGLGMLGLGGWLVPRRSRR